MRRRLSISDAGGKGRGLFATSRITKDDAILSFRGRERWIWGIPEELWEYSFQVDYDRYIVPRKGSHGWFLNHSCEPNSGILGRTSIVALSDIAKGEEMTIDYSTNVGWDGFAMECRCGERNCRRVIKSYRYLTDKNKRSYGKHVSPYLLESRKIGRRAKRPIDGN
jgi:SET domain-containing protein